MHNVFLFTKGVGYQYTTKFPCMIESTEEKKNSDYI